ERDTMQVVQVEGFTPEESGVGGDFYMTQYELLKSRSLAQRVISELDLENDPAYQAMTAPSPWKALFGSGGGDEDTVVDAAVAEAAESDRQSAMITAFLNRLSVEPVRNSRLVRVHFDSPD